MQCHALGADRRRCTMDTIDDTEFCAKHKPDVPYKSEIKPQSGVLGKLIPRSAVGGVRDDVKRDVAGSFKRKSMQQLRDILLTDASVDARWNGAFALRRRRDQAAIEALWQTLRDELVGIVRQQAAVALGKIGTMAALAPLGEALWHDRDAGVRQACAIALGKLGFQIASQDLAQVLRRDIAVFVRWDCALALGQVGNHTFADMLTELCASDPSTIVRSACQQALAQIKRK
jgi:HEAT repeat protein